MMHGYKVVRKTNGKVYGRIVAGTDAPYGSGRPGLLLSACVDTLTATVEYRQGEISYPRPGAGPLAVYKTLAAARSMRDELAHRRTMCGADATGSILIFHCDYRSTYGDLLWLPGVDHKQYSLLLPQDNMLALAHSVELLEEVDADEIQAKDIR